MSRDKELEFEDYGGPLLLDSHSPKAIVGYSVLNIPRRNTQHLAEFFSQFPNDPKSLERWHTSKSAQKPTKDDKS